MHTTLASNSSGATHPFSLESSIPATLFSTFFTHAASQPATAFVTRVGGTLYFNGQPYKFTGVNAYELATKWGTNRGCGGQLSDAQLDAFFASLRPNSMVRFWVFQSQAINKNTKQLDFFPIDRVVQAAQRNNQRLIMTIGNHWKDCDTFNKTEDWYKTGYRQVYNSDGLNPLSYWDYIRQLVPRYANSTTLGMWELMNEPETPAAGGGCSSTAHTTLRQFFDAVGSEVKRLDPNHLVSSGVIGSGQCGASGANYQYVHESQGIDVASYHDYGRDDSPMPGDQFNGLQRRINQAKTLNKPIFIGEAGIRAQNNLSGCISFSQRRDKMKAKMDAQFAAGVAGFLPWNWEPRNNGSCGYAFTTSDPLLTLLHDYPLPAASTATPTPRPSSTPTPAPAPTGNGLKAVYYDNINFTGTTVSRIDPTINFNWGGGSPHSSIAPDTFSARWTGFVVPQYSQTYTFYTTTDDGVRLWVDDKLIVDKFADQSAREWSGTITLQAGVRYSIKMEYYENGGQAVCQLRWSSPSQPKQIIPQARLFSE
jgi:mannan endo-1,4-beta-mannosidase